jgi:hypothetical protein
MQHRTARLIDATDHRGYAVQRRDDRLRIKDIDLAAAHARSNFVRACVGARKITAAEHNSSGVILCEVNRYAATNHTVAADDEGVLTHFSPSAAGMVRPPNGLPHHLCADRALLGLLAHVMRCRCRGAAAIVVTARSPSSHASRFLATHVMRHFGLRPTGIMMPVPFRIFRRGLRYRRSSNEGSDSEGGQKVLGYHVRSSSLRSREVSNQFGI